MNDEGTLSALRLADSFLPVGTYTVSYGLEQFAQDDRIDGAEDLRNLLATYLRRQVGPAELIALRAAHTAAQDGDLAGIKRADRRLSAVTLAAEFRESAQQSGDRLLSLQRDLGETALLERYADRVDAGDAPGNFAVVLGIVAAFEGIDERTACLVCCHGFVTGLLGAAQRLLSLGHTDAQRVLDDLQSVIDTVVDGSADRGIEEMDPFAPLVEILAAEHERADRRLFAS
jgi:urease accessory protein